MFDRRPVWFGGLAVLVLLFPALALAHNVASGDVTYVKGVSGAAVGPFLYLGAKHMVTGYDHLLFLAGVVFFLYRGRDVVLYVTLFTLGHSVTLLAGVLAGVSVDAYLVDAVIGFSVVYKAFENLGGMRQVFGINPDTRIAVFVFGLCHGLGLATKLQALGLAEEGLVTNLVSFNVGVELGQGIALAAILLLLLEWRQSAAFARHALAANSVLMMLGFLLAGYQLTGYFLGGQV